MGHFVISAGNVHNQSNSLSRKENNGENKEKVNKEKIANNVAMHLKDADQKLSGKLSKCWKNFVNKYNLISSDHGLPTAR